MRRINLKILLLLLFFVLITFITRILPIFFFPDESSLHIIRADAEYNLRQIEVMVHNFLQYDWFDPMTAYPYGKDIGWGPLFPVIAGAFAIILGASQQSDIIHTVSFVPPLMAAAMVPIVYFIAKSLDKNRLTGIIAAGIIPFISFFFLYYTAYGYVDHHAAEILFSSLFFLFYILAINTSLPEKIYDFKDQAFVRAFGYSVLAGLAYCACYFTSPTTVLFLVILSVYTFFSCIITHISGDIPLKVGFVNTISLIIPAIFIFIFGIKYEGYSLTSYTVIHVIIPLCIILVTWFMILISAVLKRSALKDRKVAYPLILIAAGVILAAISGVLFPKVYETFVSGINLIFGFGTLAIAEMQPWSLDYAILSYHFAFILAFGGFLIAAYKIYSKKQEIYLFLVIWTIVTLYATIRHLRFEYFLAVPFSILSAMCISFSYSHYYRDFSEYIRKFSDKEKQPSGRKKTKKSKKREKSRKESRNPARAFLFLFVVAISVLFFANSIISDISFGENYAVAFEKNKWIEGMEWMRENTPDPGVNYFGEYSRDTFTYPDNSYGVMCWWDFGHIVTLIGKRIPTSNPFQNNVVGSRGCANFFIAGTEDEANKILDNAKARFVVTNSELTTRVRGISAILSWLGETDYITDYIRYMPDASDNYQNKVTYSSKYYHTMVVRLQNLDGTYIKPSSVEVVTTKANPLTGYESIAYSETMDYESAALIAGSNNKKIIGTSPNEPDCIVPALRRYRLVYESPDPDDNIKIFEYVGGYEVSGNGIVELNLVTNTGREFVYRQKSENGRFILPYSTVNNPYDVKASGKYHVLETGKCFDVYEEDIGSLI